MHDIIKKRQLTFLPGGPGGPGSPRIDYKRDFFRLNKIINLHEYNLPLQ